MQNYKGIDIILKTNPQVFTDWTWEISTLANFTEKNHISGTT